MDDVSYKSDEINLIGMLVKINLKDLFPSDERNTAADNLF